MGHLGQRGIALLLFLSYCGALGCASPPPLKEYTLARVALEAAKDVGASRFSSGFWYKAEDWFRRGEKAYKEVDYTAAKQYFSLALESAERAENSSRLKKHLSGDVGQ